MPAPTNSLQAAPNMFAITPSDSAPLSKPVRQLRCKPVSGAAGTVRIQTIDGDIVNTEIDKGEKLDVIVTKVFATGTTATGLEGLI